MNQFELDGTKFRQAFGAPNERASLDDAYLVVKTTAMLDYYRSLQAARPRRIMEVGMYEGGSLVFFDKLFRPERLVGIDARKEPVAPLEAYKADKPHIVTHYGLFQETPATLEAARASFPDGIDLVVDDASHHYRQTRATFEMLFPLVAEGGHYVIEDWSWSHQPPYQNETHAWFGMPALTNLVFEVVAATANCPAIAGLHVDRHLVSIRRGPGAFHPRMLDLGHALRGREMPRL